MPMKHGQSSIMIQSREKVLQIDSDKHHMNEPKRPLS